MKFLSTRCFTPSQTRSITVCARPLIFCVGTFKSSIDKFLSPPIAQATRSFAFRYLNQLSCTGTCLRFVLIVAGKDDARLRIKLGSHRNGINRQKDRPRLRQAHQHRLMPGNMAARL